MLWLKRIIKLSLSIALYYPGFITLYSILKRASNPRYNLLILTYHRVLDDKDSQKADTQPGMSVIQSSFDKQMRYLSKRFNMLSLEKAVELIREGRPIPKKSAVITFDDGWRDNYQYAYLVLKKHGVPATVFLPTDLINSSKLPIFIEICMLIGEKNLWPNIAVDSFKKVVRENNLIQTIKNLDEQKLNAIGTDTSIYMLTLMLLDYRYMELIADEIKKQGDFDVDKWNNYRWMLNWDEIREMTQHQIDFGSHGKTHDILIHLDLDRVKSELEISKNIIEKELGKTINLFSYPNNDCNAEIKVLVEEAGYHCAVAGESGCRDDAIQPDLFALGRVPMNEGSSLGPRGKFSKAIFVCYIERIFRIL